MLKSSLPRWVPPSAREWTTLGPVSDVAALAGTGGRLYVANSQGELWTHVIEPYDPVWQHIGPCTDVRAMAATDGQLFVANTRDELWAREAAP